MNLQVLPPNTLRTLIAMKRISMDAGGKVDLLSLFNNWSKSDGTLSSNDIYELCQRGLILIGDGSYWLPEQVNTPYETSKILAENIISDLPLDLSVEMLFRVTPLRHIPGKLKVSMGRRYYNETAEEFVLRVANYLIQMTGPQGLSDPAYNYYLTELFGETVTESHIPLDRLSVHFQRLHRQCVCDELNQRREELLKELAQIDADIESTKGK